MKKFFKFLIIIFVLLYIVYIVWFNFNKIKPDEFISEKFLFIVKTDNIFKLFNKLDETGLLNSIFYNKEMKGIYTALVEIKDVIRKNNSTLFGFINSPAVFVVTKNRKGVVLFDTGLKTPLYKITAAAGRKIFYDSDKIKFSVSIFSNYIINKLVFVEYRTAIYFAQIKNILIVSLNKAELIRHIRIYFNNRGINNNYNYLQVKSKIGSSGLLKIFFNTRMLLSKIKKTSPETYSGLKTISIFSIGGMSFSFEKEKIIMTGFYSSDIKDEIAERLFLSSPRVLKTIELLPDKVNSIIGVTFDSFKDVWEYYNRILILSGQEDEQKKLYYIKNSIEKVLDISFDKTLFSWMGTEITKCNISGFTEPLFLFSINDVYNIKITFKKLKRKNIIDITDEGKYKGISIKQLHPSSFFKFIADFITSKLNMPYYIIYKDNLILSKNKELIKYFIDNREKIFDNKKMRMLYDNNSSGNIIGYWNLNNGVPIFFKSNDIFLKIIQNYNYGSITVKFEDKGIESKIIITEPKKSKVSLISGWPVKIGSTVWKTPVPINLDNKILGEFLYVTENGEINVLNFWGENFVNWPIKINEEVKTSPVIVDGKICIVSDNGNIYFYNDKGIGIKNYPLHIGKNIVCQPIISDIDNDGRKDIIFVTEDNMIYADNIESGSILSGYPVKISYDLISDIVVADFYNQKDILYPASSGDIFVMDSNGNIVNRKILSTGEELFSNPVVVNAGKLKYILLVTKNGTLFVWDKDYKIVKNFPVYLGGKFLNSPVAADIDNDEKFEIISVSADGELYFVNFDGEIFFQKFLDVKPVKDEKIIIKDINHNRKKEIIIPCADNSIKFYNYNGNKLFELEGITTPYIKDFDRDNKFEAITFSDNGYLFFYKLP